MNKLLTLTLTIFLLPILLATSVSATSDAASVEFTYSASSAQGGTLLLQGFAPEDAVSVSLRPHPVDTTTPNSYPRICRPVTQDANPEFTGTFHPVQDNWELESYMIRAVFYNDTGCQTGAGSQITPVAFGGVFDYLTIVSLQQQIEELLTLINDTNSTLHTEISLLYNTTITIETNLTELQVHVDNLQAQIDAMNHGTINLMYFDSDASWVAAQDSLRVWGEVPSGATSAEVLLRHTNQTLVDSETSAVITLGDNDDSYEVFFQPISSYSTEPLQVLVKFYDASDDWMPGYDVGAMYLSNYLNYVDETLTGHEAWLNELDTRLDDLNATVEEHAEQLAAIDDNLTAIWTEIDYINDNLTALWENATAQQDQINDLLDRVNILETQVAELFTRVIALEIRAASLATFGFYHDQTAQELTLNGLGPQGSEVARITVTTVDAAGNPLGILSPWVAREHNVVVNPATGAFEHTFDTSDWPAKGMNVHVEFYEEANYECTATFLWWCLSMGWVYDNFLTSAYNTWYGMTLPEWGFSEHVNSRTYEVWNPQTEFTRTFSFSFTAQYTGMYRISMQGDLNQVLTTGAMGGFVWLEEGTTNHFDTAIMLPAAEDVYEVNLSAERMLFDDEYESNPFTIEVDDLTKPWPEFGVYTDSSVPDGSHFAEGVFWTNNNEVELVGYFGNTTQWQSIYTGYNCQIGTVNEDATGALGESQSTNLVDYECHWNVDLFDKAWRSFGTETTPKYNFRMCGMPLGGDAVCDYETIGYDTTTPTIIEESLNPGVFDAVSGNWTFSANVTDDGVIKVVMFELVNKTNTTDRHFLGNTSSPQTGDQWAVMAPTAQVPDGYYNFSVTAIDFAGNSVTMMIDPIVDNTNPMLQALYLPDEFLLGQEMSVQAHVTDNLAGVESVQLHLTPNVCEPEILPSQAITRGYEFVSFDIIFPEGLDLGTAAVQEGSGDPIGNLTLLNLEEGELESYLLEVDMHLSPQMIFIPPFSGSIEFDGREHEIRVVDQEINAESESITTQESYSWSLDVDTNADGYFDEFNLETGDQFTLQGQTQEGIMCSASTSCEPSPLGDSLIINMSLESCVEGTITPETGACRDGMWSANVQELVDEFFANEFNTTQPDGVWFEATLQFTDAAGNDVEYTTITDANTSGIDLNQGYDISIMSATPNPVTAGNNVIVEGSLEQSNNAEALNGEVVMINGVEALVSGNSWAANIPTNTAGTLNIDATYTSTCGQNFTATTSVTVDPAPSTGGGSRGGAGGCDDGYERVDGACVPVEQSFAPAEPQSTGTTQQGTSSASSSQEEETTTSEPTVEEESTDDSNLLTGAVVGGGFGAWGWLLAFGGLLLLLGGGYLFVRRN